MAAAAAIAALGLVAAVAVASEIPDDWKGPVAAGNMLFANATAPSDGRWMPQAANGFLGVVIGRGVGFADEFPVMYGAGVFSGHGNVTPSHRAAMPSPWALSLRAPGAVGIGAALDVQHGVFLNRTRLVRGTPGCEAGAIVEQRFLASACHLDLLMYQLALVPGSAAQPCSVSVVWELPTPSPTSWDFEAPRWSAVMGGAAALFSGNTSAPEVAGTRVRTVAMGVNHRGLASGNGSSARAITLHPNGSSVSFPAVFHSDLDSEDPVAAALQALGVYSSASGESLRACSAEEWATVRWQGGVEVGGNLTIAAALNSSLYSLLSSGVAAWPFSYSPGGIGYGGRLVAPSQRDKSLGYNGHTFWDADLWIGLGLALIRPDLSRMIAEYRAARLPAAEQRARSYGLAGANWPWESAFTGIDCVQPPNLEGRYEIHISADIALSLRWLHHLTQNTTWLRSVAWPMLRPTCEFFYCRFQRAEGASGPPVGGGPACAPKGGTGNYTILSVQPPDERAGVVNSSIYTNAAGAETLAFCVAAAEELGLTGTIPADEWSRVASAPHLPLSSELWPGHTVHPEFQGYVGQDTNQASVTLLQWPLQLRGLPAPVQQDDLTYYAGKVPFDGMFTGDASFSVAALALGNRTMADAQFQLGLLHDNTPWGVWKERAASTGNPNFITGVGGMLQNVLNGFAGIRAPGDGTLQLLAPQLPPGNVTSLTVRGLRFLGNRLRYQVFPNHVCVSEMPPVTTTTATGGHAPPPWTPPRERALRAVLRGEDTFKPLPAQTEDYRATPLEIVANGKATPITASPACVPTSPAADLRIRKA